MPSKYRIHYIYKIYFLCGLPEGRYYLGKHTHRAETLAGDHYAGSGDFCFAYYKKYGKEEGVTYIKEILEINPDVETNRRREKEVIGDLWKTDPLCMNRREGGVTGAIKRNKGIDHSSYKKKINQYDLEGHFIKTWDSLYDAGKAYSKPRKNDDYAGTIVNAAKGTNRKAYGFLWRYYDGNTDDIDSIRARKQIEGRHVCQYNLDGKFLAKFKSASEAATSLGFDKEKGHEIACACRYYEKNKRVRTAQGYLWIYTEDTSDLVDFERARVTKRVEQWSLDGELIATFGSIKCAEKETGVNRSSIGNTCNGRYASAGGYFWKFSE